MLSGTSAPRQILNEMSIIVIIVNSGLSVVNLDTAVAAVGPYQSLLPRLT